MTQPVSIIPESAPFNEEQRAWLNGFLAGWIGLQSGTALALPAVATAALAAVAETAVAGATANGTTAIEEDFPWHDAALPIEDRLQLSKGRPLSRRLMAAMAQLNCGSCGYDCRRYAEAIASGEERSLKLCTPGGKDTSKKLRELVSLALPPAPGANTNGVSNGVSNGHGVNSLGQGFNSHGHSVNGHHPAEVGADHRAGTVNGVATGTAGLTWTRTNPYPARIQQVRNLNGAGSVRQTSHVEIDLTGSGLSYKVGDSLGVYPTNCAELVADFLTTLKADGSETLAINGQPVPLREALTDRFCLTDITDELLGYLRQRATLTAEQSWLTQLQEDAEAIDGWDVLDLLRSLTSATLACEDLPNLLSPLKPRLYSISSSMRACGEQVHLTVGRVSWQFRDRRRKGVASTMFADRLRPGDTVRIFVQPSHGFTVPQEPSAPAIMIGPGTGIAPFRAFLQERQTTRASGKNWLFFGDQRAETDFLYRVELESLQDSGCLTRLDLAFSRDQAEKIYVQNRMLEHGAEFWNWLQAGAHVYVCGDARRMAADVDRTLRQIITEFGRLSREDADRYVSRMVAEKRYCRDVY